MRFVERESHVVFFLRSRFATLERAGPLPTPIKVRATIDGVPQTLNMRPFRSSPRGRGAWVRTWVLNSVFWRANIRSHAGRRSTNDRGDSVRAFFGQPSPSARPEELSVRR
jgi:hypothetical protein